MAIILFSPFFFSPFSLLDDHFLQNIHHVC